MLQTLFVRSASLVPQALSGRIGWLRGAIGAAIAIGLSGLATQYLLGPTHIDIPWLVAPLGASAVLVFAVPASPLAQPWPVIGGNLISALIGLAVGKFFALPWLACSVAVGLAVAVMTLTRCLHPPGGASALLCALGATGPEAWSWAHSLPVAANVITLAAVGWVFNNATRHPWPHRAQEAADPSILLPRHYTRSDIETLLSEWNEVLDVDVDDLDAFYRALNRRVESRNTELL